MDPLPINMIIGHLLNSFFGYKIQVNLHRAANVLKNSLSFQALGGDERWVDQFCAQHITIAYYFMIMFMYLINPQMACEIFFTPSILL